MANILDRMREWRARGRAPDDDEVTVSPLAEEDLHAAIKRECQPFCVAGPTDGDPFASMFGAAGVAANGQGWPRSLAGPLVPLLQLDLRSAHFVPDALADVALLQVFVELGPDLAIAGRTYTIEEDGAHVPFVVRAFSADTSLGPMTAPDLASPLKRQAIRWDTPIPDYADQNMAVHVVDTTANNVHAWEWAEQVHRSKIGGWPATLHGLPWWDREDPLGVFEPVLQIATEPDAGWNFPGAVFIGRGIREKGLWAIDWQRD